MIDFDEEIAKFQPSLEIDQAEEAIFKNDMTDISKRYSVLVMR